MKIITYAAPHGGSINITRHQARILSRAGIWPRDERWQEYCQVERGLHEGTPTWSDAEIATMTSGNA